MPVAIRPLCRYCGKPRTPRAGLLTAAGNHVACYEAYSLDYGPTGEQDAVGFLAARAARITEALGAGKAGQ